MGFDNRTFTVENNQPKEYQLSFSNRFDEIIVSASRKAEKLQEAPDSIFDASLNYQWDDWFTSNSPVFPGSVSAKNLVDLTLGLNLSEPLRLEVVAINLFNNRFRALPGFPRLGRTVIGRLVMNLN